MNRTERGRGRERERDEEGKKKGEEVKNLERGATQGGAKPYTSKN